MMLVASNHWGPQGKPNPGNAPEVLINKADVNTLIQNHISTALHPNSNSFNNKEMATQTHNEKHKKNSNNNQKDFNKCKPHIPKAPWKAKPPSSLGEVETK